MWPYGKPLDNEQPSLQAASGVPGASVATPKVKGEGLHPSAPKPKSLEEHPPKTLDLPLQAKFLATESCTKVTENMDLDLMVIPILAEGR